MNDLEFQERIAKMSVPEIIDEIVNLNEAHNEKQTALLSEILVRSMQQAERE